MSIGNGKYLISFKIIILKEQDILFNCIGKEVELYAGQNGAMLNISL